MKKLLTLVAAAVFSVSAVFAESAFHIGAAIPVDALSVNDHSFTVTGFDFTADFTHIADAGFTWKIGFDAGSARAEMEGFKSYDLDGGNFAMDAGFGWSFIHNEKMTLSLTGDIGFDIFSASYNSNLETFTFLFYIGPEVSFTFKFLSHLGVFANVGLYYATGSTGMRYPTGSSSNTTDTYDASGIIFKPKFGISIPF